MERGTNVGTAMRQEADHHDNHQEDEALCKQPIKKAESARGIFVTHFVIGKINQHDMERW